MTAPAAPSVPLAPWRFYVRVGEIEARPWTEAEARHYHRFAIAPYSEGVSPCVNRADDATAAAVPPVGYAARNPANHADQWYIAPDYFAKHYSERVEVGDPRNPITHRIGPDTPDNSKVICPVCTSQFQAISVDDQKYRSALEADRDSLRDSPQASQVAEQMARDDVRELKRENERMREALGDTRKYIRHDIGCRFFHPSGNHPCDCGMGAAINRLNAALHPQSSERGAP